MNPRKHNQVEKAIQILGKSAANSIIKDDSYLLFIFKKTERIVSAIYMVTKNLPDSEPLKTELRAVGLDFIKDILSPSERALFSGQEYLHLATADLARLLSLLNVAYVADFISTMNFSLFRKEVEGLLSALENKGKSGSLLTAPLFPPDFFDVSLEKLSVSEPELETGDMRAVSRLDVGAKTEGENDRPATAPSRISKGHEIVGKKNVLYKKPKILGLKERSPVGRKSHMTRFVIEKVNEERKQMILKLLSGKDSATMKDFLFAVKGCSEKTIQRRLLELVRDGLLKREGEKRWSAYSLVNLADRAPDMA